MKRLLAVAGVLIGGLALLFLPSCEKATSPPNQNTPPNTTVANIPKSGDTLFALVTLHWDGEDNDGYIASYQYRYVTYHVRAGDSVVHDWKSTTETSLTIAFESSDLLNYQVFQVRAVDNDGAVDPTPAEKRFYTDQAIPPRTQLVSPRNNTELFVIEQITDWWRGIELTYTGRDPDGELVEFGWSVDGLAITWTTDTTVSIPPSAFKPPLAGAHVLKVTSRDNTNLVDPVGDSVTIRLVRPTFTNRILIIDETQEQNFPYELRTYTDARVDSFYASLFGTNDSWDYYGRNRTLPSKDILGQYKLIIWHADDRPTSDATVHRLPNHTDVIKDYLNVGGKFVMSGWRILKSFAWTQRFPVGFEPGSFVYDYLHITRADETVLDGDFIGGEGFSGFSSIRVDSLKLLDIFPFNGKLAQINFMSEQAIGGFAKKMYIYQNAPNSTYFQYRGQTCGIIYYGTSFDVAVLGFPIFFINGNDARTLAREILQRMGV